MTYFVLHSVFLSKGFNIRTVFFLFFGTLWVTLVVQPLGSEKNLGSIKLAIKKKIHPS